MSQIRLEWGAWSACIGILRLAAPGHGFERGYDLEQSCVFVGIRHYLSTSSETLLRSCGNSMQGQVDTGGDGRNFDGQICNLLAVACGDDLIHLMTATWIVVNALILWPQLAGAN